MTQRLEQLRHWLQQVAGFGEFSLVPASADASFRRYFRVQHAGGTAIAVDAPPEQEDSRPFVVVARALHEIGLNVPVIQAADLDLGFLLVSDLGSTLYLDVLDETSVERLYGDALGALLVLQAHGPLADTALPPYDRDRLLAELGLFPEWFLDRHLGRSPTEAEHAVIDAAFELLIASALEQPQVTVHRDYHSRNLMRVDLNNPGILDFQDAVVGPVTYDLVSLLRDCYIRWPRQRVESWALGYHELALQSGVLRERDEARFLRWFDLMGLQRHLKVLGIFARLWHRDGKPGYLADLPRVLEYAVEVTASYPELAGLHKLLTGLPSLDEIPEAASR
jgi:aminoglycoside/choline kinase family phosphotransferase